MKGVDNSNIGGMSDSLKYVSAITSDRRVNKTTIGL
jgi:hypothetical protein